MGFALVQSLFCSRNMNTKLLQQQWLHLILAYYLLTLTVLKTEGSLVNITFLDSAVAMGAVCLDGSPPAYHFDKGSGAGINNWLIHIEGGGWCNNVTTCLNRTTLQLGSSEKMAKQVNFTGILSNEPWFNPDFYNWNRVILRYCDGASFTGDVEAVDPVSKLHYRGARIFVAVVEDFLAKGMKNAKNAILTGCSAGGLASILHCDKFRSRLPPSTKLKCLADAGFFLNATDISGVLGIANFFNDVVTTHGSAKNLPESCTSRMEPNRCFFPQYVAKDIRTPLFIVNAAYDSWQVRNILIPGEADRRGRWRNCRNNIAKCSTTELKTLQAFRSEFTNAIKGLGFSTSQGFYINSCYTHCQTEKQETWFGEDSPVLDKKKIAEAVGDWFYDRRGFQAIDCPYPCDETCCNKVWEAKPHYSYPRRT